MLQTTEIEMQFLFAENFRAAVDQAAVCLPPPQKKILIDDPTSIRLDHDGFKGGSIASA